MDDYSFHCLKCNHTYMEQRDDFKSDNLDEYIRFMGYCKRKCWAEMGQEIQFKSLSMAYTKGDIMKRRHHFYHTELPEFHRRNPAT